MTSYALLRRNPDPSEEEIRRAISGNLCRCTGYVNIVKAVRYAAAKLEQEASAATALHQDVYAATQPHKKAVVA